jgi:hypothetical protein
MSAKHRQIFPLLFFWRGYLFVLHRPNQLIFLKCDFSKVNLLFQQKLLLKRLFSKL